MQVKNQVAVKTLALVVAAVVVCSATLREKGIIDASNLIILLLWGVSPYAVFLGISYALERFTKLPRIYLIDTLIALLMLASTLLVYVGTLGDTASPYYGFIFLVVPPYLFVGSSILLVISVFISRLIGKRT